MFDNNKLGEIRPNQLITTFGPGSIVDAVKDSVTVLDLNYWKEKGKKIIDGRLASYLGVDCFYMPRTSYSGDIPVVSFPYMHVCSNVKCGRIFDLRENFDLDRYLKFGVTCPECHRQAYPSRFITICENGHMDDFPWSWWVHGGNTTCKGTMRMYSTGNTSTLADMWVECSCGARRSMSGATQHENFEGMKCSGHHPFRPNHKNEKCDKEMIPSQRGASNVYFPVMRSAISIPPWINPLYNLIDEHLRLIDSYEEDFGEMGLDKAYQKYFSAFTREEFDAALLRRRQNIKEFTEIKQMEYNAITHHADPVYASNKKHFKAEEDPLPDYLLPYFKRVIRITRLREVRVLLGFTRVDAPDPDADEQTNIVYLNKGKTEKWLPAAEVHGEGVFIEFNRDSIDAWLRDSELGALSQKYAQCYKEFCESKEWTVTTLRDARYVLMHTFAHLLIKQMSMSSGYSSSAIRERIYFGDDMSGVLLYTGSADKEGSLGGLVELGNIDQLMQRFFGFEQYIRAGAQKTIGLIRNLDIVDSLEKFVEFENKSKLTNAKKLLKAKNSPVLQMKKNDLLENLKKHSRYKTMFKFEEDHIVISSQKEAAAFIKMLNDDIVRSELTGKEYDSSSKMLLGPVGASQ